MKQLLQKTAYAVARHAIPLARSIHRRMLTEDARRWVEARGDQTLRFEYDLDERSVVFDAGGYLGDWAAEISARYCSTLHVFEPVNEFAGAIRRRFARNPRVHVHQLGLAGRTEAGSVGLAADASSIYASGPNTEAIQLVGVLDFIEQNAIERIDLLKLNIEGAEYDVLEKLLEGWDVRRVHDLQIQFHQGPGSDARRDRIRSELARTHELTYDFRYIWENWRLRAPSRERPSSTATASSR
jgi:FkbM family methyltransferase